MSPRRDRLARALADDESGAAILEFALVLPLFLLLLAGTFEIGRAVLARAVLERAVESGARYLARLPNPTCQPACSAGARRALAAVRQEIAANLRIPDPAIKVRLQARSAAETVGINAEIELRTELGGSFGLPAFWSLAATHEERRLVE